VVKRMKTILEDGAFETGRGCRLARD
jgi:hypothetical protein